MARKPMGQGERSSSEWAKHLRPYTKRRANKGARKDGRAIARAARIESESR